MNEPIVPFADRRMTVGDVRALIADLDDDVRVIIESGSEAEPAGALPSTRSDEVEDASTYGPHPRPRRNTVNRMINQALSEQDVCRIAAKVRLTGELLEAHGSRALKAAASWSRGPRSANLDPDAGGWRYDVTVHEDGSVEVDPIPNDTTGESALDDDRDATTHARLLALIHIADHVHGDLRAILQRANPDVGAHDVNKADTPAQISAAGWCVSCHRDDGYCEPVSMRPDGTRRYRDYCTWCGEWVANARKVLVQIPKAKKKRKKGETTPDPVPPIELLAARHRGQRITSRMVDDALRRITQRAS